MSNTSGHAYALTTLCPIRNNSEGNLSSILALRTILQNNLGENPSEDVSPVASVPNTYLARFFILDDTPFQGYPYQLDNLKSSYLVFVSDFHGKLDAYLKGMYQHMKKEIFEIWKYCYGFEDVLQSEENGNGEAAFVRFIKKCQVETTFYFNGSTDDLKDGSTIDSLDEQLKSLYLKQELSKFVFDHQGVDAEPIVA